MVDSGIGLYIHLPWCVRKCPYCDFNSHPAPQPLPADRYVGALARDLDEERGRCGERTVTTVFIGGGTPSLFPPDRIAAILDAVQSRFAVAADAEVTMEANPGTIERGRFSGYRAAGVNRVSLGAQTFNRGMLQALGRIHTPDDTRRAVEELIAAGIGNFNLDLMYALPDQSTDEALTDIRAAVALGPTHVSLYQLTLEPGTAFFRHPPPLPSDDQAYTMQEACRDLLRSSGYEHYEVSGFAQPGYQCRHNRNYWQFGDYVGIGSGAHGKLTVSGVICRTERLRSPKSYLATVEDGRSPTTITTVAPEDLPFEFMLNALRLRSGFREAEFVAATGLPFATIEPTVAIHAARGLMERNGVRWKPTSRGFDFLNEMLSDFLPNRRSRVRAAAGE